MRRRDFIAISAGAIAGGVLARTVHGTSKPVAVEGSPQIDAAAFHASRRFVRTEYGRTAYIERGRGPAALFVHGYPLNGFQWRGALERLHAHRRCLAPDLMGMGFTQAKKGQEISSATQVAMLASLLDKLRINRVDLVANDSGGIVAQLFLAKYPQRVRTLLLTNCDVDENSPPPLILPSIEQAKKGTFRTSSSFRS